MHNVNCPLSSLGFFETCPLDCEYLQLNSVALGKAWWANWGMVSLISVVCSISHDLLSASSFYTLSTLSHSPGSSQWGGQRLPQGKLRAPTRCSPGVQDELEWLLVCKLCTLCSFRKLLNEVLDSGIKFLWEKVLFLQIRFVWWQKILQIHVCTHVHMQSYLYIHIHIANTTIYS